jgi:hypothetical protein
MDHHLKKYEADKHQDSMILANVLPTPASAPVYMETNTPAAAHVYLATSTPALSPCSNQGLDTNLPGHGVSTHQGRSTFSSRLILPDFIV